MFEADPYFHLLTLLALTPKIIYFSQAGALSEMLTFSSKRSRDSVLYNMHGIFMRTSCRLVSLKRSQDMSPPLFLHCYCTRNLSWERSLWSDQEVHRFLPLKPSQSTHLHIIWIFLLFYINLIFSFSLSWLESVLPDSGFRTSPLFLLPKRLWYQIRLFR